VHRELLAAKGLIKRFRGLSKFWLYFMGVTWTVPTLLYTRRQSKLIYVSLLIIKQAIIDLLSFLGLEWIMRQAIVQSLDLGEIPVT